MDRLMILGIIVATLVYLVLRPDREPRSSWAVVGMTALFFFLAFVLLIAFMLLPHLDAWPSRQNPPGHEPFSGLLFAGAASCVASLVIVLALSFVLKGQLARRPRTPAARARRGPQPESDV